MKSRKRHNPLSTHNNFVSRRKPNHNAFLQSNNPVLRRKPNHIASLASNIEYGSTTNNAATSTKSHLPKVGPKEQDNHEQVGQTIDRREHCLDVTLKVDTEKSS